MKVDRSKVYATYGLIGVNCAFFVREIISGGTQNVNTLYQLGGLVPENIWQGEWWRLINANFLHFGWVHFLTNMLALYFIGSIVEVIVGARQYLVTYLLSAVEAMFVFSLFIRVYGGDRTQILVGASAAIMAMIGVILAVSLRSWYFDKSYLALRRLRFVSVMVIFQFISDALIPQVSSLSHLLGLICGFFNGCFLKSK